MHSYMQVVDLLLALATQHQELRQAARDREACVQAMEGQLRSLLVALETQKTQLQGLRKAAHVERERLEAEHQMACLERDAAKDTAKQLQALVNTLQEGAKETAQELQWFKTEHDRLRRECSYMGLEMEELTAPVEAPMRYASSRPEICDKCPALDALCNSLQQELQETKLLMQRMRGDREKANGEKREVERRLEAEKEKHRALVVEFNEMLAQHQGALEMLDWQDAMVVGLHGCLRDLTRGHLLQTEAGERLALAAQEEADMHRLLRRFWYWRGQAVELGLLAVRHASELLEETLQARDGKPAAAVLQDVRQLRVEAQGAAVHAAGLAAQLRGSPSHGDPRGRRSTPGEGERPPEHGPPDEGPRQP